MNFHPDVLAAHAEFGGDLESMQKCYEYPDLVARIDQLERENAELRKAAGKLRNLATHANNCGHRFGHDCDCYLSSAAIRRLAEQEGTE